jgi:hypothetical protein
MPVVVEKSQQLASVFELQFPSFSFGFEKAPLFYPTSVLLSAARAAEKTRSCPGAANARLRRALSHTHRRDGSSDSREEGHEG